MLITTATFAEAAPIINALALQQKERHPFPIFANEDLLLAVTGIGTLYAAIAVSHIVTKPLLNIGICAGREVGKLYNIKKVIDDCSNKCYILPLDQKLPNATLRTLAHPAIRPYKELVDMEAAGIMVAAKKFGITPKIVKIVSDAFDPAQVSKERATSLVEANLDQLLDIIANLKKDGS